MTGIVLAGGDSKRMGENKALLKLCDKPVIEWAVEKIKKTASEVIIVTDKDNLYDDLADKIISDKIQCEGKNPMVGIFSGLSTSTNDYNLVVACDMPFLNVHLIRAMYQVAYQDEYDVVVPRINGYLEPLCAIYNRNTRFLMEKWIKAGAYKIPDIYAHFNVKILPEEFCARYDSRLLSFLNLNYPYDYERAQKICKEI